MDETTFSQIRTYLQTAAAILDHTAVLLNADHNMPTSDQETQLLKLFGSTFTGLVAVHAEVEFVTGVRFIPEPAE